MTDTNDKDRRPARGGRGAFDSKGDDGRSFLSRRPKGAAPRPAPAERRVVREKPAQSSAAEDTPPAEERIAKVIARAGLASRRDAEAMIEAGRVTLNGEVVASPALNVGPDARIAVDGEPLPSRERTRLWLFHKPRGLVTTVRDPEGRPTVFDSLPEEMPRVVAIGRLDINTEGLLLLTNDGGLAKVVAQPATGWTRRYRARAHGAEVTQAHLDKLKGGITIDGMEYGPVEAVLDRVQGDNSWISIALREGKNREVKRILEHLGLQVNRLIRLSFGPFQLGELESGLVEEIRTKVLKEQLGQTLAVEAGADFESPVRTPIAPPGRPPRPPSKAPRPRRAGEEPRPPGRGFAGRGEEPRASGRGFAGRGEESRAPGRGFAGRGEREDFRRGNRPVEQEARPALSPREERGRDKVWRADDETRPLRAPRHARREDPKTERHVSAERPRSRSKSIEGKEGRRVLVERIDRPSVDEGPRHRRDSFTRPDADDGRPPRAPRGFAKPERRGPPGAGYPAGRGGAPSRGKPGRFDGPPGRSDGPSGRFDGPSGRFGKPSPGRPSGGGGKSYGKPPQGRPPQGKPPRGGGRPKGRGA